MFIGRNLELADLNELYKRNTGGIAVIYGRRRVGKSTLIKTFLKGKHNTFYFEGIEAENTSQQLAHFSEILHAQLADMTALDVRFTSWNGLLSYFTKVAITKPGTIIVFDELQWMAVKRSYDPGVARRRR